MAIYRYQHESLVDTVQILTNEKGGLRAYLYADSGKDTEKLRLVKQALRGEGYKCVPTLIDDKPVLEVRGFQKTDELLSYLDGLSALKGKPEILTEEGDKQTRKEKTGSKTLKLAGFSYITGDIAYMTYATRQYLDEKVLKSAHTNFFNRLNIFAGVGYALGSLALAFYGSRDQSLNTINEANKKVYAQARKEGIDVPDGSTLKAAMQEKDRGFFGNINHTLAKYPSETLNSVYVGVGASLIAVGAYKATRPVTEIAKYLQKEAKALEKIALEKGHTPPTVKSLKAYAVEAKGEQKAEWYDVGLGTFTAGSALIGLTVKEKAPVEGQPKRHGLGRVIDFIQEKPLRATGIGFAVSTVFHAIGTMKKWNSPNEITRATVRKTVIFRGIFVAMNALSEVFLALSSKGHGVGVKPDNSVDQSVIAATAELIMRQPPEKRNAMANNMAGYMSSRDVLGGKAETIATELHKHMEALKRSPWTKYYVPNTNGEMVEAAPEEVAQAATVIDQPTAPVVPDLSKLTAAPSTIVSNAEHITKHQEIAHAVA